MLLRLVSTPLLQNNLPWFQVITSPTHMLSEITPDKTIAAAHEIPSILVQHSADTLQRIIIKLIRENFTGHDAYELEHTVHRVRVAHDQTGEKRDSGHAYIQHVFITTLLSWTYAQLFLSPKDIDLRQLLLASLYHDTVEDTHIFHLSDPGKKIDRIAQEHGEPVAIAVAYLTKMPLHINKKHPHIKEAYLAAHYTTFLSPECTSITRFIKCCDRIANFADFAYSDKDFFLRKYAETKLYFPNTIHDSPAIFQDFFWQFIEQTATRMTT